MKQIRRGVFETNSSSVHSITMCTKSDFDAWRNGELYKNDGWWGRSTSPLKDKTFLTKDEALTLIKEYAGYDVTTDEFVDIDMYLMEHEIYDYESWSSDYETDVNHYTTPNGEEIVAVCYYGHG